MCQVREKGGFKEKGVIDEGKGGGWKVRGDRGEAANLLASYSFKWRKTESVDCQEKCSRRIFNSSKNP